ncbi:hypothetical protein PV325_011760, partial [Microctonus aethiopoides]
MKTFHKTRYLCNQLTTLITNEHNNDINCKIDLDLLTSKLNKLNWLFGTPNSEDAKFYKNSIDSLLKKNKNAQLLMRQQISLISNTIASFNATIYKIKDNEELLNLNTEDLNKYSIKISSTLNKIQIQQLFSTQSNLLLSMLADVDEQYSIMISSITYAERKILHPDIISPQNLLKELSKLESYQSQRLPLPLTKENIKEYYKLSKQQSLEGCSLISPANYICHGIIFTRTIDKPSCETTLLNSNTTSILSICKEKHVIHEQEFWYSIKENQWIFAVKNPQQLFIHCKSSPIEVIYIEKSGILKLNGDCKCHTETFVLETTNKFYKNLTQNSTFYEINNDCCLTIDTKLKINPLNLRSIKPTNIVDEDFKQQTKLMDQLDETLKEELQKPISTYNFNWLTSITSILFSLIAIGLCLKIYNTNVTTTPQHKSRLYKIIERPNSEQYLDTDHEEVDRPLIPSSRRSESRERTPVQHRRER